MRRLAAVLVLVTIPAHAAPPRESFGQRLSLGGRVAPLGLALESESTLRWRVGPDGDALLENVHFDVGAVISLTPAQVAIGGVVELEPAAFCVLRARALALGWTGLFGALTTFDSLDSDWSPERLDALAARDEGRAARGWQLDLEAQLRMAVGGFIALASVRPTWIHADVAGPYYEPYQDLMLAPDDLVLAGNALVGWRFAGDSFVGARWELLVGDAAGQPRQTVGGLLHWVVPLGADATELALDGLLGVYAEDRYRAGQGFAAIGATVTWRLAR